MCVFYVYYNISDVANAAIKVSKVSKGLKKIRGGMKGTPSIKALNIFRRLRRKTKQHRKKNHFARNFKGKVIDGLHELYTLTAGMMLGIRGAVSNLFNYLYFTCGFICQYDCLY